MDDFDHEVVNSPIHETEGNVVDTSSGDTILPDSEATDSNSSRDFSSDHYERLATLPLANTGKRIKSKARKPRLPKAQKLMSASIAAAHSSQGVEDATFVASLLITPPTYKHPSPVLALQTQVDTLVSTDTQRQLRLDTHRELRIHDTCHVESIQRKDNDDNDPSGNIEGDRQYADVNPISRAQGELTSHTIEGTKNDSGVNEEILLLEFFQDSEEEETEKLECLDDIDELFDDVEEDIEKSKDKVTYEGSDGLNVPYNFIQDDIIPDFSYDEVTDSMDYVEDITTPDETAQSKIDSDVDTTHTVSPKLNEEPVMYRNTGMTREQWSKVVNMWMKVLLKSPIQPAQKERYVNKERCIGRITSWFYDDDTKLFALKRSDGVQYLKLRIKYFNTLPRCEMNGLATKPLINRSKCGLADMIANLIKREGGSGKYESLKLQKGKRVKIVDQKTEIVTWKYMFKPVRAVQKIPLKKIPQDFLGNMKWWYVDVNTGEARIDDKDNKVIVSFYDAMNLINFSKKD
ncbi:hypothetical protein L1987_15454 [Smallanthus sonchifolius]|uniref:Uncharacterized protein n=1 Tax=Smallanthus sonchifolius TaxID=185202 RepID=A0ACB9J756_9ASTR|nr:hypothetical protein L1987_15454 [Smallanthus sonchifolius]